MLRAVTAVTAATANVVFAVAGLTADDEAGSMANVVNPVANVVFAVLFFFAVVFLFFGGAFFARVIRRRSRPETSSE